MTREEIADLPVGAELDVLVHEKVLGLCAHSFKVKRCTAHDDPEMNMYESMAKCHCDSDYPPKECVKCGATASGLAYRAHYTGPKYSTDITDAFTVVDALNKTHYLRLGQEWLSGGSDGGVLGYEASFWRFKTYEGQETISVAPAPALAICRAALAAHFLAAKNPPLASLQ